MRFVLGLYSHGMHDFVLRELEIGNRAAMYEDSELNGWSALNDLDYIAYVKQEQEQLNERNQHA